MGRKEKRKQQRIKKKEISKRKFKGFKEVQRAEKVGIKFLCQQYMKLSVAATLLAVKDEKGLSKEMTTRVLSRINSILEEFNSGSHRRLIDILEVVQDELNVDLKEI